MSDELRNQVNAIIRDEIQETINEYIDSTEEGTDQKGFGGFVKNPDEELKVNIPTDEVDKIIKEYKKIKKFKKSNLGQIQKMGLVDKHGKPL